MKNLKYTVFSLKAFLTAATVLSLGICMVFTVYLAVSKRAVKTSAEPEKVDFIIDAGHGGADGGTQSADGVLEKELNLEIAHKLNGMLVMLGYKTVMTRTDDAPYYDENADSIRQKKVSDTRHRMEIIEGNPEAILISIHQNYFTQSKYTGSQVFYSANNENSKALADCIQESIATLLQPENKRVIKKCGSDIYLMYHAELPAVMVECGFLSNSGEAALLGSDDYQQQLSLSILNGILNYLERSK